MYVLTNSLEVVLKLVLRHERVFSSQLDHFESSIENELK